MLIPKTTARTYTENYFRTEEQNENAKALAQYPATKKGIEEYLNREIPVEAARGRIMIRVTIDPKPGADPDLLPKVMQMYVEELYLQGYHAQYDHRKKLLKVCWCNSGKTVCPIKLGD